jgi:hypothetical protein
MANAFPLDHGRVMLGGHHGLLASALSFRRCELRPGRPEAMRLIPSLLWVTHERHDVSAGRRCGGSDTLGWGRLSANTNQSLTEVEVGAQEWRVVDSCSRIMSAITAALQRSASRAPNTSVTFFCRACATNFCTNARRPGSASSLR